MVIQSDNQSNQNLTFKQVVEVAREYGYEMRKERKKRTRFKNYIMFFHEGGQDVAMDKDLKGEALRVYLYAVSCLDFGNKIVPTQKEIAEKLGMSRPAVTRVFGVLNKKDIFLKGKKDGKCTSYYLNPKYGWKGDGKDLKSFWEDCQEDFKKPDNQAEETPLAS